MQNFLKDFMLWMQKNRVERAYREYFKDVCDIRNGLIGNYREIQNEVAYSLFKLPKIQNFIKINLFDIDIFDLENSSLITILKDIDYRIFSKNAQLNDFLEYSDRVGHNRPRAAFRKYIEFLIDEEKDKKNNLIKNLSEEQLTILKKVANLEQKFDNFPLNTIFYGPPGTGKTYNTILRAVEIIENRKIENYDEALDIFKNKLHNQIEFITFHQNYSYEDFIQGLRPVVENNSALVFEKKDGIFKQIADRASNNLEQKYVIVIDEINRANISRVFGELITLIEPDKRSGGAISLEVKLPSGDLFSIPSNLFIIGTMNTADKSIALLDIALRRRFEFEAFYPKYHSFFNNNYAGILQKMNNKIIELKGYDFQIGHSYFMNLKDNVEFKKQMNTKIIPLLLEYFMNDKEEVISILESAGLFVKTDSWPLKIRM